MTSSQVGMKDPSNLPLVCICIPTYNSVTTIQETLESILRQTYQNLIVHISDNASTDATLATVRLFSDPRIRIHANTKNTGAEENFNYCIQIAEGDYTAIFHADDIYEPNMIAKQIAFLEANPKVGAVLTAATKIDIDGIASGVIGHKGSSGVEESIYDFALLFKTVLKNGNFLVCPSAMVRTRIYKQEIERWRGDLFRSSADLDVWFRIASAHLVAVLSTPLMRYREDNKQFSNRVRTRTERADFFRVMDYYLAKPVVRMLLTDADQINLRQLVANDKLWRAINNFSKGEISKAKNLMRGALNIETLRGAFNSRRGSLMLMATVALQLMIVLQLKKSGVAIISKIRKTLNK